ncbi:MAG: CRISPR-associated endonuclease Cas2 [Deltaproteobacteria bacterium]|nr:CRISPR-associated endonuclease Cas2 [Deltaproteobacteria bacterium]
MTVLISYDIESDRIRTKLARFLEKKGIRLQKSVFAIEIDRHFFNGLLKSIEAITQKKGKVAVFRLCEGCLRCAIHMDKDIKTHFIF